MAIFVSLRMMISQSIHGVEQSRIILLDFKKVYPDAQVLMMERNYRSSKEIVETASKFIKRNKKRYPKEMHTENGTVGADLY